MTSRMLSGGLEARLDADEHGLVLTIEGIAQSHLGRPGAPSRHASYRWMLAAALELLPPRGAASVLHLGGGAAVDAPIALVASDVFGGGRVPAAFTSLEFCAAARAALRPDGALIMNSADGPPLRFLRGQLATLRHAFAHVALISTGSTLAGARFSNIVLLASDSPLPVEAIRERLRAEHPPVAVLPWARLERFVAEARAVPVTDATAVDSPVAARSAYLASAELPPPLTERDGG